MKCISIFLCYAVLSFYTFSQEVVLTEEEYQEITKAIEDSQKQLLKKDGIIESLEKDSNVQEKLTDSQEERLKRQDSLITIQETNFQEYKESSKKREKGLKIQNIKNVVFYTIVSFCIGYQTGFMNGSNLN